MFVPFSRSAYGKNHPDNIRVSGGGVFRARLRPDGFVSVDSGALTTRTLRLEGKDLFINGIGPITVSVLNTDRRAIGTAKVIGDSLRHRVTFKGKSVAQVTPRNVARLRFTVAENGQIYSFTIH